VKLIGIFAVLGALFVALATPVVIFGDSLNQESEIIDEPGSAFDETDVPAATDK
jgi:hypothetical protein